MSENVLYVAKWDILQGNVHFRGVKTRINVFTWLNSQMKDILWVQVPNLRICMKKHSLYSREARNRKKGFEL